MSDLIQYSGDQLAQAIMLYAGTPHERTIESYLPSPDLVEAVNLAIWLRRPLLLMGEPGCGKTRLAEAVAYELHKEQMNKHYFRWDIKSTSQAKEGLYRYDAIRRLRDAQVQQDQDLNPKKYVRLGELGKAFLRQANGEVPNVVLIDEIDKADIDFPNDLLLELDKQEFVIEETRQRLRAKSKPIVLITSNREKELPPAFLRRCLFHEIKFPEKDRLAEIVSSHFDQVDDELLNKVVASFLSIRERLEQELATGEKKPSTSELIQWFQIIQKYSNLKKELAENQRQPSKLEQQFLDQLDLLDHKGVPYRQVLLKTWEANQFFADAE